VCVVRGVWSKQQLQRKLSIDITIFGFCWRADVVGRVSVGVASPTGFEMNRPKKMCDSSQSKSCFLRYVYCDRENVLFGYGYIFNSSTCMEDYTNPAAGQALGSLTWKHKIPSSAVADY
jgi:hypothetical protein